MLLASFFIIINLKKHVFLRIGEAIVSIILAERELKLNVALICEKMVIYSSLLRIYTSRGRFST